MRENVEHVDKEKRWIIFRAYFLTDLKNKENGSVTCEKSVTQKLSNGCRYHISDTKAHIYEILPVKKFYTISYNIIIYLFVVSFDLSLDSIIWK